MSIQVRQSPAGRRALAAMLLPLAAAAAAWAQDRPADPPAPPPAAQPAGRWHAWVRCEGPICRGVGGDSMWMADYNCFPWRYDLKTGAIDSATLLDGLPADLVEEVVVLPDGATVVLIGGGGRVYLCRPGQRWEAMPNPRPEMLPSYICLDADGRLCTVATHERYAQAGLFRWAGAKWTLVRDIPDGLFATGKKWMPAKGGLMVHEPGSSRIGFLPDGEDEAAAWEPFQANMSPFGRYWVNGRCCVFPQGEWLNSYCTWEKAWWCGPGKLEPARTDAELLGLDYQAGDLLEMKVLNRTRGEEEFGFPAGPGVEGVRFAPGREQFGDARLLPVRDPTGRLWVGNRRWDGKQWRPIQPDNAMPVRFYDRYPIFRFEAGRGDWATDMKDVPFRLIGLDPSSRTGWLFEQIEKGWRWRLVRLSPNGPEVLRTVESENWFANPCFRTDRGEWWFGDGTNQFTRLDDKGPHRVAVTSGWPRLGPDGTVWVAGNERTDNYFRYDPARNDFTRDSPWEQCAFRFGPWTLARLNNGVLQLTPLRWKTPRGEWGPFTALGGTGAYAGPEMIHGQRMIVRVEGVGVVVYDAQLNRSVLLDTRLWERAAFDPQGRLLLIGFYSALLFDGDPFAANPLPPDLPALLERMDRRDFDEREAATKEMARLARLHFRLVEDLLTRDDLSPEVRWRLEEIAKAPGAEPVGLFRRMHPLLVPSTQPDGSP